MKDQLLIDKTVLREGWLNKTCLVMRWIDYGQAYMYDVVLHLWNVGNGEHG